MRILTVENRGIMKYKRLPNTELDVSLICLGMTYSEQNNERST